MNEILTHKTIWRIDKWLSDYDFFNELPPYEIVEFEGNLLTNVGINLLWNLGAGAAGTPYNAANSFLAVGSSSVAALPTDTALTAEVARVGMMSTYPQSGANQQIIFQSLFDGNTANVHWLEFGVFNAASLGTLLNHKVSDQGTKTTGQSWQLNLTIILQ